MSGEGAVHLQGIEAPPEEAKALRRGDIIATHGANIKKANGVI